MARLPRADVPGWPVLLQQRSHDGVCWLRTELDLSHALADLREAATASGVQVHAYGLTPEQMQLVVTPDEGEAVSRMMQAFGRRYVAAFNRRHGRSGGLWAARYRSVILDPACFLLDAMQLVEDGAQGVLESSSLPHHLGQRTDRWLVDHGVYWALGNTPFDRHLAWRRRVEAGLAPQLRTKFQSALRSGWPLVAADRVAALEVLAGRRLMPAPRGRPRKLV